MPMSKFAQALAFASLIQIGASSELCQDSSDYDGTADYSITCLTWYDTLALATTACAAVEDSADYCLAATIDATDDDASVATYYCNCYTTDLVTGCPLTTPDYTSTSSCDDSSSSWDYSSSTAETDCEDYGATFDEYAVTCCDGGSSICADYTSQLCSDDADYTPLEFGYGQCFMTLDTPTTQVEAMALCDDLYTDDECYGAYSDYDSDGTSEWFCYCKYYETCPLPTIDLYYDQLCGNVFEDWSYTSSKTQCKSDYSDMASLAENCCSSEESICAGYCYSADSTVSTISSVESKKAITVPLSEIKVGDKILSMNAKKHEPTYEKVLEVRKGKSSGDFYEIEMVGSKGNSNKIRATPHHEFPLCVGKNDKEAKTVHASNIKQGDCFLTASGGEQHVHKVNKQKSNKKDYTYSLEVENSEVIFVGGVATKSEHFDKEDMVTHFKPQATEQEKKKKFGSHTFSKGLAETKEKTNMIKTYLRGEEKKKVATESASFVKFIENKKQKEVKLAAKKAQVREMAMKSIPKKLTN